MKFEMTEYGVTVTVADDGITTRVTAAERSAVFFSGTARSLSYLVSVLEPVEINPVLLKFAQWYDEREEG